VIRVWYEPGAAFRARITTTSDVAAGAVRSSAASTPEEVVAAVTGWLAKLPRPEPDGE
jgi:hypothetical protein